MSSKDLKLLSMLEYGTFGRLSAASTDMADAMDWGKTLIRDIYYLNKYQITEDSISRGRLQLIDYLINMVETIVLADEAVMTLEVGPGPVIPKSDDWRWERRSILDVNDDRIFQYPDEANSLLEKFKSIMPLNLVELKDANVRDAWFMIHEYFRSETDFPLLNVIKESGGIDRERLKKSLINSEEFGLSSEFQPDFIEKVESLLGTKFRNFRESINSRVSSIPIEMLRSGPSVLASKDFESLSIDDIKNRRYRYVRFMMACEAYIFTQSALQNSSVLLPTWSIRPSLEEIFKTSTQAKQGHPLN